MPDGLTLPTVRGHRDFSLYRDDEGSSGGVLLQCQTDPSQGALNTSLGSGGRRAPPDQRYLVSEANAVICERSELGDAGRAAYVA
jgi:hypothetical protein